MLPHLIANASTLYQELSSGIRTNLNIEQVIKLALLASQVSDGGIRHGVIDEKFILFGRSPDNLAILIPLIDKIHVLRDESVLKYNRSKSSHAGRCPVKDDGRGSQSSSY